MAGAHLVRMTKDGNGLHEVCVQKDMDASPKHNPSQPAPAGGATQPRPALFGQH
ncbi:MAG: hypothetical protein RJA63_1717 [Pseudomonadota bacterium]|jgi:hypothetical protein